MLHTDDVQDSTGLETSTSVNTFRLRPHDGVIVGGQPMVLQALQDKLAATAQKATELETQLSAERERSVSAEEHSRALERQLAEEQQDSGRLAKKHEESEAELAAQVWARSSS